MHITTSLAAIFNAAAFTVFLTTTGYAQAPNCSDALIKNTIVENTDYAKKLSILKIVKQSAFEEARTKWGAKATFPLGGIDVTPEMDYAAFNIKRAEYFNEFRYNLNESETRGYAETYLSEESRSAYVECLKTAGAVGTRMWVLNASPDDSKVTVRVTFLTNAPDPTPRSMSISLDGATLVVSPKVSKEMERFSGSPTFDFSIRRTSLDETAIVTVNVTPATAGSATLYVPRRPKIQYRDWEIKPELVELDATRSYSDVHKQHPETLCIPSRPLDVSWMGSDGELLLDTVQGRSDTLGAAHGDNPYGGVTKLDKKSSCAAYNIGTDGSATGHAARYILTAVARRPVWKDLTRQ